MFRVLNASSPVDQDQAGLRSCNRSATTYTCIIRVVIAILYEAMVQCHAKQRRVHHCFKTHTWNHYVLGYQRPIWLCHQIPGGLHITCTNLCLSRSMVNDLCELQNCRADMLSARAVRKKRAAARQLAVAAQDLTQVG